MRKAHRLTPEDLLPYQWQMPRTRRPRHGEKSEESRENKPEGDSRALLNWSELFGNSNPVEIEVGMGKGLFLLTSSASRADTNFFGIEMARKYQLYATARFARRQLRNVKTVCADARWVMQQFVPSATVSAVHVYFPDPWWKARHKKRRVFTTGFAAVIARALKPGGRLKIASDVDEYFGTMMGIAHASPAFRELQRETNTTSLEEGGYQTNFERKAREKGTPVWRAEFERTDAEIGIESEKVAPKT